MAERQPEVRDGQPSQPSHTPTVKRGRHGGGRNDLHWWLLALIPTCWAVAQSLGIAALVVALMVLAIVVVGHVVLTRRGLDGEKIVGGIIGVLGGVLGVVTLLNIQFPSSVLWMSGIVCRSPYHLEYDVSHYSRGPGESSSSVDYACVNGESLYDVNDFMVFGLQALVVALALCAVAAVGFVIWRRLRS